MRKLALLLVGFAALLFMGQTITIDNLVATLPVTTQIGAADKFYDLQGTGKSTTLAVPWNLPLTLGQNGVSGGTLNLNGGASGQSQLVAGSTGALTLTGPSPQLSMGAVGGTSGNLQLNGSTSGNATLSVNATGIPAINLASASTPFLNISGTSGGNANVNVGGANVGNGVIFLNGNTSGSSSIAANSTAGLTITSMASNGIVFSDSAVGTIFTGVQAPGTSANHVEIDAATATNAPALKSIGTDTNINLNLTPKGTGGVVVPTSITSGAAGGTSGVLFLNGSTSGQGQVFVNSTASIGVQAATNQSVVLIDGSNGTVFQTIGTGGTVAATIGAQAGTTGNPAILNTFGSDTNSNLELQGKGTGGALVHGVTSGTAAPAGYIGEVITATQSTPQNLTIGTAINVTSISLTAGDWDVAGICQFPNTNNISSTTAGLMFICSISTTSITPDGTDLRDATQLLPTFSAAQAGIPRFTIGTSQFNFSATTTVFLVTEAVGGGTITFGSGTNIQSTGTIKARRMH